MEKIWQKKHWFINRKRLRNLQFGGITGVSGVGDHGHIYENLVFAEFVSES